MIILEVVRLLTILKVGAGNLRLKRLTNNQPKLHQMDISPSSLHSRFSSRKILSNNCVMHDETMQFSIGQVRVFIQNSILRGYKPPSYKLNLFHTLSNFIICNEWYRQNFRTHAIRFWVVFVLHFANHPLLPFLPYIQTN